MLRTGIIAAATVLGITAGSGTASAQHGHYGYHHSGYGHHGYAHHGIGGYVAPYGGYPLGAPGYAAPPVYPGYGGAVIGGGITGPGVTVGGFYAAPPVYATPGYGYGVPYQHFHHHHHGHHW